MTLEELEKPQIMIESTYGDSHPGSAHLDILIKEVEKGVNDFGGKSAKYFTTDICDGQAQGHDGMNYSLVSREFIADMIKRYKLWQLHLMQGYLLQVVIRGFQEILRHLQKT